MSLKRKQIRAALRATILNQTDAGSRVYANRVRSAFDVEIPVITIRTKSEEVEVFNVAPIEYKRTLSVEIEIIAEANDSCDDVLDILGAQVEARLLIDFGLGGLCGDVILTGADITLDKSGDNEFGSLILRYDVIYYSNPANDASALEWLERVDVEYELQDSLTGTEQATDIITGLGE